MLYTIPLDAVMAKVPDSADAKKVCTTIGNKLRHHETLCGRKITNPLMTDLQQSEEK